MATNYPPRPEPGQAATNPLARPNDPTIVCSSCAWGQVAALSDNAATRKGKMLSDRICLSQGKMSAQVGLQGGTVLAFARGQGGERVDLMRPTPAGSEADPLQAACFPLLPFGNRVRGNGFEFGGMHYYLRRNTTDRHYLHGDGWLSRWQIARQGAAEVMLTLSHVAGETPYSYAAEQHFALAADSLTVTLAVRNTGEAALPFGLGLHPYFPCTPRTRLRATAACCWPEAEDFLPGPPGPVPAERDFSTARTLPREWVNTAFGGWDGQAEIVWPENQLSLDIATDAAFGVWLLFISDPDFQPGYAHEYFCFEPMTHAPDAHNRADLGGLAVLAPGESLRGAVTFRCRELASGVQP